MANGTMTNTLKLAGFIESSNVVIYSSCYNSLSKDLTKILRLLAVFQLFHKLDCSGAKLFSLALALLLYVQKQKKQCNISDFAKHRLMKRLMMDL